MKTTNKQKLKAECDALWSKIVRTKADRRCQGITLTLAPCQRAGTDAHHILSRKYTATRWIIENGLCLCRQHHNHDDLPCLEETELMNIGKEAYERLWNIARDGKNWKEWELAELKESLKEQLELLLNRRNDETVC